MDFVSHALWGGIAFGRRNRKVFLAAAGISVLPDLLTEGLFSVLYLLQIGGMPSWNMGHPNITEYPLWAQTLYNATHSLPVFAVLFLVALAAWGPIWILGAWAVHILIDIPTHSIKLFPTPFLWPLSDFKVDGVGWGTPVVIAIDAMLLIAAYAFWIGLRNRKKKRNGTQGGT